MSMSSLLWVRGKDLPRDCKGTAIGMAAPAPGNGGPRSTGAAAVPGVDVPGDGAAAATDRLFSSTLASGSVVARRHVIDREIPAGIGDRAPPGDDNQPPGQRQPGPGIDDV